MNTTKPISLNQHFQFVDALRRDTNRACYLVKEESQNIGVIQLNEIKGQSVLDFGLYTNPALIKSGAGLRLAFHGIQYTFENLNIEVLNLMTHRKNKALLKLWSVFGVKPLGVVDGILIQGQLRRDDFLSRPQDFKGFIRGLN